MSAVAKHEMTVDDFLAWAAQQPRGPGKFELIDGKVMQQQSERVAHARAKLDMAIALRNAIRANDLPCEAIVDGPMVRISAKKAYQPDGLVHCGSRLPADDLEVAAPVIVYEVLSPSNATHDHGEKLQGYLAISSVRHYLIVDADEMRIIHHRRAETTDGGSAWFTRILGRDERMNLDPPGIELAVADVFEQQPSA